MSEYIWEKRQNKSSSSNHNSSCSWESGKRKWSISSDGLWSDVVSKLGCVSMFSVTNASDSNDSSVNGAGYAIWELDVNLRHLEVSLGVGVVFLDISLWWGIHHISLLETFDGLVLGYDSTAVCATNSVSVTLIFLVSTVVSPFRWHIN